MIDLEEEGVDDVQGGPEVEDEEATALWVKATNGV